MAISCVNQLKSPINIFWIYLPIGKQVEGKGEGNNLNYQSKTLPDKVFLSFSFLEIVIKEIILP
jgi:hypothetical protein